MKLNEREARQARQACEKKCRHKQTGKQIDTESKPQEDSK